MAIFKISPREGRWDCKLVWTCSAGWSEAGYCPRLPGKWRIYLQCSTNSPWAAVWQGPHTVAGGLLFWLLSHAKCNFVKYSIGLYGVMSLFGVTNLSNCFRFSNHCRYGDTMAGCIVPLAPLVQALHSVWILLLRFIFVAFTVVCISALTFA